MVIKRRKPRDRKGTFGVPPPVSFDFDSLNDNAWLTSDEVAAVLRRSKATLPFWRTMADHPLKWERVLGKPLYRVRAVRAFIAAGSPGADGKDREGIGACRGSQHKTAALRRTRRRPSPSSKVQAQVAPTGTCPVRRTVTGCSVGVR